MRGGITHMATTANTAFRARLKADLSHNLRQIKMHRAHYAFMLPYFLVFTVFMILPVGIAIVLGFTSFNMLEQPEFIGFQNYFRLFLNDEVFVSAISCPLCLRGSSMS